MSMTEYIKLITSSNRNDPIIDNKNGIVQYWEVISSWKRKIFNNLVMCTTLSNVSVK